MVRERPRARPGDGVAERGKRVRPGPAPAAGVGRQAHDPVRRSRGRGPAEAPAPYCLQRVPDRLLIRTAARILVDQLLVHGVDTAYCVPGESYVAVLDAI